MTISWRANIAGTVDSHSDEADVLALVNGLCIALGAAGLFISDGLFVGARVLPIEETS